MTRFANTEIERILLEPMGDAAIEIFNVSRSHSKEQHPCTCSVCLAVMGKMSQWLKAHDQELLLAAHAAANPRGNG